MLCAPGQRVSHAARAPCGARPSSDARTPLLSGHQLSSRLPPLPQAGHPGADSAGAPLTPGHTTQRFTVGVGYGGGTSAVTSGWCAPKPCLRVPSATRRCLSSRYQSAGVKWASGAPKKKCAQDTHLPCALPVADSGVPPPSKHQVCRAPDTSPVCVEHSGSVEGPNNQLGLKGVPPR